MNLKLPAPVSFAAGLAPALAAGWLLFPRLLYEEVPQPLPFSHEAHAEAAGTTCDGCHALGPDGRFAGVPRVEACAGCHAEKGGSPGVDALVEGYVTPGREVPWLFAARQPDNVFFPHAPHLALAKLECARCHGPQGKSAEARPFARNRISGESRDVWGPSIVRRKANAWDGMKMADCIRCHREAGRESACLDCHK